MPLIVRAKELDLLNLHVIGSLELPATAKENTIFISTPQIGRVFVSSLGDDKLPTGVEENDVLIKLYAGKQPDQPIEMEIYKIPSIKVNVYSVYQYQSNNWIKKKFLYFKDGIWHGEFSILNYIIKDANYDNTKCSWAKKDPDADIYKRLNEPSYTYTAENKIKCITKEKVYLFINLPSILSSFNFNSLNFIIENRYSYSSKSLKLSFGKLKSEIDLSKDTLCEEVLSLTEEKYSVTRNATETISYSTIKDGDSIFNSEGSFVFTFDTFTSDYLYIKDIYLL